ncbi:hypothetical protein BH10BDE1_BH10BDE1_17340 [soil metagenome]
MRTKQRTSQSLRRIFSAFVAIVLLGSSPAYAASKTALAPEALSAKALLEDMLARRYTQGLATKVDKQSFSISAELDLTEIRKAEPKPLAGTGETEPISDLMLGMLDPETLMKNSPDDKVAVQKFLDNYKIKTVEVHVGLSEALAPEVKAEVEKWLTDRLTSEFGKTGKGAVDFIKLPTVKIPQIAPKTLWDWLSQFQSLAGQLALAIALILGVLLWQMLTPRASSEVNQNGDSKNLVEAPLGGSGAGAGSAASAAAATAEKEKVEREKIARDEITASEDIVRITERLNELLPKVGKDIESVMRSWCQMGEPGWLKVATFAEAVGKGMGKLPIPVDALTEVSKVFSRMTEVTVSEKRDVLQKSYWDLLTVLNLGPSALDQPFGYLGGFNIGMVSQVLLEQNPKMKTVVSLFMPPDLRMKYMAGLSMEAKKELLESAAGMSEIPSDELRALDGNLMSMFKPTNKKDVVPLEMTLTKLVAALTPVEEILLLSGMKGKAVDEFKLSSPSLAFLGEWPDDKLSILLSQASPDELSAYGRVRPDLKDRLLALAPAMTAEMVGEELARPDRSNIKDKGVWIESFAKRLKTMVLSKELNLDEIFSVPANTDVGLGLVAEGTGNDSKRVA